MGDHLSFLASNSKTQLQKDDVVRGTNRRENLPWQNGVLGAEDRRQKDFHTVDDNFVNYHNFKFCFRCSFLRSRSRLAFGAPLFLPILARLTTELYGGELAIQGNPFLTCF